MSRIIYYLGAGASCGARDSKKINEEGLPLVKEIPSHINEFRKAIANAPEVEGRYIQFGSNVQVRPQDISNEKARLVEDIDSLRDKIQEHATIDTYARKLYLTGEDEQLEKLKDVLCAFFLWEQLTRKADRRYDTFLANVLKAKTLLLPEDISIISWNYDSQIELAYRFYKPNSDLPTFERNIQGSWPTFAAGGKIFKVNGAATFADKSIIWDIKAESSTPIEIQIVQYYSFARVDTSQIGYQYKTHLSFAWEDSPNQNNMLDSIRTAVERAEQMVVIGYSFPFFNRESDRQFFRLMPMLKKIYIQDKDPEKVKQSIEAVLPTGRRPEMESIYDCSQFFLPAEL